MNILTIHHLCYYLEEIGIIDQASVTPFLSLYSFSLNQSKKTNSSKIINPKIFENVLCAYLKKIFSVEKNFIIFSNKIISKFKQHFMVKQYNGLTLLFSILSKKYNSFKIQSLFKIIKKIEEINLTNLYTHNNTYANTTINSPNTYIKFTNEKKTSFDSFRLKHLKKNKNEKDEIKYEKLNKSFDFIQINRVSNNNTIPSANSRNTNIINENNKNIQLEYQKKQFLSKIKREHIVKFKRTNSNSAKKLKNNNSYKNFESILLNNFSPKFNNKNNMNFIYNSNNNNKNNNYNNKEIITTVTENLNEKNDKNTFKSNRERNKNEEFFNNNIKDILKERISAKSENTNFNSFIYASPQYSNINTISNNNFNKNKIGHIIKKNDKNNNIKKDLFYANITNLNLNDIYKIKQKLESLNYFNLNYN